MCSFIFSTTFVLKLSHSEKKLARYDEIYTFIGPHVRYTLFFCAVVSLKPRHPDWVIDFDFKLNLFSLPSPCNYYLFSRRIP